MAEAANMVRVTVRLAEEDAAAWSVLAEAEGVSRAELFGRMLARSWLTRALEGAGSDRDRFEMLAKSLLDIDRRLSSIERLVTKPKRKAREATEKPEDGVLREVLAMGAPFREIVSEGLWRDFARMRVFTKRPLSVEEAGDILDECRVADENGWDVSRLFQRCVDLRYRRPLYAQHLEFLPPSHHEFAKRK